MIVKILRYEADPVATEVHEVKSIELCKITFTVNKDKPAQENLVMYFENGSNSSTLLFTNDEVFLCNSEGKTVDRWLI